MKLRKQITAAGLIILIFAANLFGKGNNFIRSKAAGFDAINHPDVFLKQVNGDMQCTLVSATMLIRRAAILLGYSNWKDITVDKVKQQAWVDGVGLKYTFTYEGITVNKAQFGSDSVNEAIALLQQHPEGIVLYHYRRIPRSHAVLLTDYTDGMFYCADPAEAVPSGRIPITQGLVQVKDAEYYYYVSSPIIPSPTPLLNEGNTFNENGINGIYEGNTLNEADIISEGNTINEVNIINCEGNYATINEGNAVIPVTDINTLEVELSRKDFYYDGNEKKPEVTIPGLVENLDYTVTYYNNVYPGTAAAVITGIGSYTGTTVKTFVIRKATIHDYFNDISVAISKQTVKVGKTAKITVTVPQFLTPVKEFGSDGQYNEVKISYSSGNSKIAKVNSNGKISGKKKGKAQINVTAELPDGTKKVFTFTIKVKQ